MKTKFTEGPWALGDDFSIVAPGRKSEEWGILGIATVGDEQWKDDDGNFPPAAEERANALLITAAPELLEACNLALDDFEVEGIELNHDTVTALRSAIKKAAGGKHEN